MSSFQWLGIFLLAAAVIGTWIVAGREDAK